MDSKFTPEERKAAAEAAEHFQGNPFWKSSHEDDHIEGIYLGESSWVTDYGEKIVATINAHLIQSGGESVPKGRYNIGLTKILLSFLHSKRPIKGASWIRIEFTGTKTSKTGLSYKTFRYMQKPTVSEFRW
jgi:hypothetical protein